MPYLVSQYRNDKLKSMSDADNQVILTKEHTVGNSLTLFNYPKHCEI